MIRTLPLRRIRIPDLPPVVTTPATQPMGTHQLMRRSIYLRDDGRCVYCLRPLGPSAATTDHLVPRSLGGLETLDNLSLCCVPCNRARGTTRLTEWIDGLPLLNAHRTHFASLLRRYERAVYAHLHRRRAATEAAAN